MENHKVTSARSQTAWRRRGLLVTTFAALFGCGSSEAPTATDGGAIHDGGETDGSIDPNRLTYAMHVSLPAGSEQHRCIVVEGPADDRHVIGGSHSFTSGSHHVLLYTTDYLTPPPGTSTPFDCYETSTSVMAHVRGVIYGSQVTSGDVAFPQNVGLPIKRRQILLLQAHYLNASDRSLEADVSISLALASPGTITTEAGLYFFYDKFIRLPGNSSGQARMSCPIRANVQLLSASSHMHSRGVGYRAFIDPPNGAATSPFYQASDWQHPEPWSGELPITAGSTIRFECDYQNRGATELFQGQSATQNEMCMFVGMYYPALGEADDFCYHGHSFGTGSKSCGQTTACLSGCPAGTTPTLQSLDVTHCWQSCIADSCPSAGLAMKAQFDCVYSKCATECQSPNATTCTSCAFARCGAELNTCQTQSCTQ